MKSITIVRIQKSGRGIFRPKDNSIFDSDIARGVHSRHNNEGFPTPWTDEDSEGNELDLILDNKKWFCAYKSVEQMQEWIKQEEIEYFVSVGFKIYMLEVTEYQEGSMQVLYTKKSIVTKTNITNIFI